MREGFINRFQLILVCMVNDVFIDVYW